MRELASLAESDRKIALDRYRFLWPHLEDGRTLSVVASEAGVAYSTAQRWVSLSPEIRFERFRTQKTL
jgi:putative transposase